MMKTAGGTWLCMNAQAVVDVGGDIRVGTVIDPWGNVIGLIYNPHFGEE